MTDQNPTPDGRKPSLRDRIRPVEFLMLAAGMAVFVGLIALLATREWLLAVVGFGVAFIVSLVVLAMFALGFKPDDAERRDLAEQNHELPGDTDAGPSAPDAGPAPRSPHD